MGKTGTTAWAQVKGVKGKIRLVPKKEGLAKTPGPNQRFKAGANVKQFCFGLPQVVLALHIDPQLSAIAQQCTQAQSHFGRDATALRQNGVKRLAGYTQITGEGTDRHPRQLRQHIFAQDRSWVGRATVTHHQLLVIVFQIKSCSVFTLPLKGDAPWTIHVHAIAL